MTQQRRLLLPRAGAQRVPHTTHQISSQQMSPPPAQPTDSTPWRILPMEALKVHSACSKAPACKEQPQHEARQDLPLPLLQGNIKSLFGTLRKRATRYYKCSTLSVVAARPVRQQTANVSTRHWLSLPVPFLLLASSGVKLLIRTHCSKKAVAQATWTTATPVKPAFNKDEKCQASAQHWHPATAGRCAKH
jgi:hypothetical protein